MADVKHYVGIDVIPSVVDKCRKMCEENSSNPFDSDAMKFDFYCCPSEQLDKRHNFIEKYKEYFDSVFFTSLNIFDNSLTIIFLFLRQPSQSSIKEIIPRTS